MLVAADPAAALDDPAVAGKEGCKSWKCEICDCC
jgi:hypothetical protein